MNDDAPEDQEADEQPEWNMLGGDAEAGGGTGNPPKQRQCHRLKNNRHHLRNCSQNDGEGGVEESPNRVLRPRGLHR
jgi:hypothetical protein